MYCGQCGAWNPTGTRFCGQCGAALVPGPPGKPPSGAQRATGAGRLTAGALIAIVLVLALAIGVNGFPGSKQEAAPPQTANPIDSATPFGPPTPFPTETPFPTVPPFLTDTPIPTVAPDLALFPALSALLSGDNNDVPPVPKLRNISYDAPTQTLAVDFNMDQNITDGLTRDDLKRDMSAMYTAIFRDDQTPVKTASLHAWTGLVDKYGNTSYGPVYTTALDGADARRINWQADTAEILRRIIPGLWRVLYSNPALGMP